jgi:AcrR family transcriptional regulator
MTPPPSSRRRAPALTPEQRRETIVRAALPLVAERGSAVTTAEVARAAGIAEGTIFRVFADKNALLDACVAEALRPDQVLAELTSIDLEQPLTTRLVEAAEALQAHLGRMGAVIGNLHATGRPLERRAPAPGDPGGGLHGAVLPAGDSPGTSADGDAIPGGGTSGSGTSGSGADGGRADGAGADAEGESGARGGRAVGEAVVSATATGRRQSQDATLAAVAELFEPERDQLRVPPETAAAILTGLLFTSGRRPGGEVDIATTIDVFLNGALGAT